MKFENLSRAFEDKIVPILDNMVADYFTVKISADRVWVGDGYVPSKIAVYNVCFAYTLHIREVLKEEFPDAGISVYNNEPHDVEKWLDYKD